MRGGLREGIDLVAELGRRGERALELGTFVGVEGVEGVGGREAVERLDRARRHGARVGLAPVAVEFVVAGHVVTPSTLRSRIIPSRNRVFTVPSGTPSRAAISLCVSPP